jgi:hypothetical protein
MRLLFIAALVGAFLSLSGCGERSQEPDEMNAARAKCAAKGMGSGIESFGFFTHDLERVICVKRE